MRILLALLFALSAAPAFAQIPDTFLRETYDHYVGDHAVGLKLTSVRQLQEVFTPEMARAIADARKAKRLNRDPLVDAPSFLITNMSFSIEDSETGSAEAEAHFSNKGEDKTITLTLVKLPQGWRIADVVSDSGSLRERLNPPPLKMKPPKKTKPKSKAKTT